jgi:hypothetical protein
MSKKNVPLVKMVFVILLSMMFIGCDIFYIRASDFEIDLEVVIQIQNNFSQPVTWFSVIDINDGHSAVFDSRFDNNNEDEIVAPGMTREIKVRLYKNPKTNNWHCEIAIRLPSGATNWYAPDSIWGNFTLSGAKEAIRINIDVSGSITGE